MPIEHHHQMLKYGSSSARLFVQLKQGGAESTPTGTPTITVYNPEGTALVSAQDLTQQGSTAWWYRDIDISATGTWAKGLNYRAEYTWIDDSITYERAIYLDVVRQPWNDPEITTEEVALKYAEFDGLLPTGWTDWTIAINDAHLKVVTELRKLEVGGTPLLPSLVLDRNLFAEAELRFAAREIAQRVLDTREEQQVYVDNAHGAWNAIASGPFTYDHDDDGNAESGEDVAPSSHRMVR